VYRRRLWALAAIVGAYALAVACSETLPSGLACPTLCPGQNIVVLDTTIDGLTGLSVDTTVTGYPPLGDEPALLLANGGDSLDVRSIVRFDSVPYQYIPYDSAGQDTLIPVHQAVHPYVRVVFDTTSFHSPGAFTVLVYDVDTVGNDTAMAVLASLFRQDRLIGDTTFGFGTDTARILLDSAIIGAHLRGDHLIRLGFKLRDAGRLRMNGPTSALPPVFSYYPDTDSTNQALITARPKSTSPQSDTLLRFQLLAYPVTVIPSSPPIGEHLDIGGIPARRVFLQFALPSKIVDSSTVVRATITLTKIPNGYHAFFPHDTLGAIVTGIIATPLVTDPTRLAAFATPPTLIGLDTTAIIGPTAPVSGPFPISDSVNFEFVLPARHWSGRGIDTVSRAIVLRAVFEGSNPLFASFYSASPSTPAALRPHIHVAYIKQLTFGIP
jgi:hypothetical protein